MQNREDIFRDRTFSRHLQRYYGSVVDIETMVPSPPVLHGVTAGTGVSLRLMNVHH